MNLTDASWADVKAVLNEVPAKKLVDEVDTLYGPHEYAKVSIDDVIAEPLNYLGVLVYDKSDTTSPAAKQLLLARTSSGQAHTVRQWEGRVGLQTNRSLETPQAARCSER